MKLRGLIFFCLFYGFVSAQIDSTAHIDSIPNNILYSVSLDSVVNDIPASGAALDSMPVVDIADSAALADSARIKSGLHFFLSVGAQFISFNDRAKFQGKVDAAMAEYDDNPDRFVRDEQKFQSVNLTFPLSAGVIWQFNDKHSVGLGAGFFYNNESIVLTDKFLVNHDFQYTLQAFPVFAEYRLLVSPDLISLNNGDYFSIFARYYWMLPHTEFSSSWGTVEAKSDPLGSGFGVFLGYRFWEWQGFSVWGEMGYLDLNVEAKKQNNLLNSWNLGGISILFRAMF